MSRWRQKGFVQDSDEDEEELETLTSSPANDSQHTERRRVASLKTGIEPPKPLPASPPQSSEILGTPPSALSASSPPGNARKCDALARPHASSLTQTVQSEWESESPDPLQRFLGPPEGSEVQRPNDGNDSAPRKLFQLDLLSQSTLSDDALSEPPPDFEAELVFASPSRQAGVQVVIPSSTVVENLTERHRASRSLRERKPIQLNPYLIEGERYRQEWKIRGLKPVAKPKTPPRKVTYDGDETQEQEFDPQDESPPASPLMLTSSTPPVRKFEPKKHYGGSASQYATKSSRQTPQVVRDLSANALVSAAGTKRRKLRHPLIQQVAYRTTDLVDIPLSYELSSTDDTWALPGSPPYSSSPFLSASDLAIRRPERAPNLPPALPTPSNSSITQDGHEADQALCSTEKDPSTIGRSPSSRFRAIPIIIDSSSSSSNSSNEDSDESDVEVQRVGKRIKGVLPASWLRLDKQTQDRRRLQARQRLNEVLAADRIGTQRGVAQKVSASARVPRPSPASRDQTQHIVINSDVSDSQGRLPHQSCTDDPRTSATVAANIAALYDQRYAIDDCDDMENDRLHLFTLGGVTRSRKRQSKLTNVFTTEKGQKTRKVPSSVRRKGSGQDASWSNGPRRSSTKARRKKYRPPALSILDVMHSPSQQDWKPPQFIGLAVRSARRRSDQGRQRPNYKHIRLHTNEDTEDACHMLQRWEEGELRPRSTSKQPNNKPDHRPPLIDRANNQQSLFSSTASAQFKRVLQGTISSNAFPSPADTQAGPTDGSPAIIRKTRKSVHRDSIPYRVGQLERPETVFGKSYESFAFNRTLRHFDQQFELQSMKNMTSRNPQLAKFLEDDDTTFHPFPTAQDNVEVTLSPAETRPPQPKRRARRKNQAKRVDVEAREYRQPSEPPLLRTISGAIVNTPKEPEELCLQGFGPPGTRYPATFDVTPLVVGTYFQSSTFIGSEELQRALLTAKRNLDLFAGHCTIHFGSNKVECGPWDDLTSSRLEDLLNATLDPINDDEIGAAGTLDTSIKYLRESAKVLRLLVSYFAIHLSFSDPIDRYGFVSKMKRLLSASFGKIVQQQIRMTEYSSTLHRCQFLRPMTYLLVLTMQIRDIAFHNSIDQASRSDITKSITDISAIIVNYLVRHETYNLGIFLEENKRHSERENGIQEKDTVVECLVVILHVLDHAAISGTAFWDLVSRQLSNGIDRLTKVHSLDSIWATAFTLLPFHEFDSSGILNVKRRLTTASVNWIFVRDLLRRVFTLYPATANIRSSSSNEYIRATLTRCHSLIQNWHWRKCDSMLNIVFDFFAKNGLRQLNREECKGSPRFLERLAQTPSLDVDPTDSAFHIFLKCLALGLLSMKSIYPEKKVRSIVLRCTPNHGRSYPKDQPLDTEHLIALRNHLDLLCTLYWASPAVCRPKVQLFRGLVQHETSHREACRQHVRAWANLATFQLSTSEPIELARPLAEWFKEMVQQTLKQYRLAKIEAEDTFKSMQSDGTTDISAHMVQQHVKANQDQVIETLRDCIAGMQNATKHSLNSESARTFLMESGVVELLELAHVEDHRFSNVIRETLGILKAYASLRKGPLTEETSQQGSEESQDYGEVPEFDLSEFGVEPPQASSLDFIEIPLWHLLSNAFGAENVPDDNLLMDCVDTWALIASSQVANGEQSWDYYFGSFSKVSWQQLRKSDQTRKFGPYFMSALLICDPTTYKDHQREYLSVLFTSLVERESMLRFQHRLLQAIIRAQVSNPLLRNLPFSRDQRTEEFDIGPDTLRSRRLSLLSSLLFNIREHVYTSIQDDPAGVDDVRRGYADVLNDMMTAMKNNYQQLRQRSTITGAYIDFVHKVVTFLQQYTSDICPVNAFFTDDAAFPLPAMDPKYVIGRLRGYAGKLANPGVAKQLSVFVQTVAQQAALDNQQPYLVQQLCTAVQWDGSATSETSLLRSTLLQSIVPAYIEAAMSSAVGFVISQPILQSLAPVVGNIFLDIRVMDLSHVQSLCDTLSGTVLAFVRSMERLVDAPARLREPYTRQGVALSLNTISAMLPLINYISSRALDLTSKPPTVTFFEEFCFFAADVLHEREVLSVPMYSLPMDAAALPHADALGFSTMSLKQTITTSWSDGHDGIFFGQGSSKREVSVPWRSAEEERALVDAEIERFHEVVALLYGDEGGHRGRGPADVLV